MISGMIAFIIAIPISLIGALFITYIFGFIFYYTLRFFGIIINILLIPLCIYKKQKILKWIFEDEELNIMYGKSANKIYFSLLK